MTVEVMTPLSAVAARLTSVDVTVRRVRADEGPVLKAIRLAALLESPSAFGSTHAAEVDQPDDDWTSRASLGAHQAQWSSSPAVDR
jgi:hypothetical protein